MGSISERRRKDGGKSFTAQIRFKEANRLVHSEAQTFDRRAAADAWIKKREKELRADPSAVGRTKGAAVTVADAIDRYVGEVRNMGRTKEQVLRAIKTYDLADLAAGDVRSSDIVAFARQLAATGIKPQTVQNYLSHLSAVFSVAGKAWGIALDRQAMADSFDAAKRLGLVAKSDKRERRPTVAEMNKLMQFFGERQERTPESAPMQRVIGFAMFSTRRLGEILRVEWKDFDSAAKRLLVRDMKHPGQKVGNNVWCDVPDEAIGYMGESGQGRIFPYSDDAIGAAFTRACYTLGINTENMPDRERLHFHDLRHEGVSRLFELGWTIPRVAEVSGHRSWQSLQRYTQLRQVGDKWTGWKWIESAASR